MHVCLYCIVRIYECIYDYNMCYVWQGELYDTVTVSMLYRSYLISSRSLPIGGGITEWKHYLMQR
jgi:hypothetical protein